MAEQPATTDRVGRREEHRPVSALLPEERTQIQRRGHRGIITMAQQSQMETDTTAKSTHGPPNSSGLKLQGIRGELLAKHVTQMISEKFEAERNQPMPKTEFSSTTQRDFCVKGFVPRPPETTQAHDFKTEQAITFWSENYQRVQGVTAVQTTTAPFRRSALFSTPISERLDDSDVIPDDCIESQHFTT